MGSDQWEWFCGRNSSDLAAFDNRSWSYDAVFDNHCLIDAFVAGAQVTFFVASAVVLFCLYCLQSYRNEGDEWLIRAPTHVLRWLGSFVLVVIAIAATAEGILTDSTYTQQSTQPHLYIAGLSLVAGGAMSLLYFSRMEKWRAWHMSWLLVIYWVVSIATTGLQLEYLNHQGLDDVHVVVFDIAIILVALFSFFLILEISLIFQKIFENGDTKRPRQDYPRGRMFFVDRFVNLYSQLFHSWLNWLFVLGFKKPLEVEDLGTIPTALRYNSG